MVVFSLLHKLFIRETSSHFTTLTNNYKVHARCLTTVRHLTSTRHFSVYVFNSHSKSMKISSDCISYNHTKRFRSHRLSNLWICCFVLTRKRCTSNFLCQCVLESGIEMLLIQKVYSPNSLSIYTLFVHLHPIILKMTLLPTFDLKPNQTELNRPSILVSILL